ncbi:uncharacterized protein LOC131937873 [Physella acuta]|uniref:uncharacterized protein LOC131937873 n=1 Tax=Physella acuta TaxID=109671 RepID=UPI0027DB86D5|nr:uncharacterized protein LOC131937873 [Physella acuta]
MLHDCAMNCLQCVPVILLLLYDCGVYVLKLLYVIALTLYNCGVYCLQSVPVMLRLVYDCVVYCLESVPVILRLVYDCVVYMLLSIIQSTLVFFTILLVGIDNWISTCWVILIDLSQWIYPGFIEYFQYVVDCFVIPYWPAILVCALVLVYTIAFMNKSVPINKTSSPVSSVYAIPVDTTMLESIDRYITTTWDKRLVGIGRDAKNLLSQVNIHIVSAKHVVNARLLETYNTKRETIRQLGNCVPVSQLPNCSREVESRDGLSTLHTCTEVNEFLLLHGTKSGNISNILSEGLQVSKSRNGLFGYGLYFAESSTKADQYTDNKDTRSPLGTCLYMLICRVTLGRVYVTNERIHSSEIDKNKYDSLLYDPPKGKGLFREFIVFDSSQVMPAIVIEYQRKF